MGRRGGGYSSYRGRRTFTDVLKVTAVVLGVLVLLLLAALWLLGRGREDPGDAPAQSDQSDFSQPDASQADPAPPDASGEGDESLGERVHHPLALVHPRDDMEFRLHALQLYLIVIHRFWKHADHMASVIVDGLRDRSHQPPVASAVHQGYRASGYLLSECLCCRLVALMGTE